MVKPVVISGAWAVGAVVVPLVEAGAALDLAAAAGVVYRFLFVLPNVLVADWPDRQGDASVGLQNSTSGWSPVRLRITACLVLGVAVAGAVGAVGFFGAPTLLLVDMLGPLILLGLSARPLPTSRWYYGFTIDAVMAWPLVTAVCAGWL
jgi:4-hydroxybenzoate polyprenyltransferase